MGSAGNFQAGSGGGGGGGREASSSPPPSGAGRGATAAGVSSEDLAAVTSVLKQQWDTPQPAKGSASPQKGGVVSESDLGELKAEMTASVEGVRTEVLARMDRLGEQMSRMQALMEQVTKALPSTTAT